MRRALFVLLTLTACGSQNSRSAQTPVVQAPFTEAAPRKESKSAAADNAAFPKADKQSQERSKNLVENGRALLKDVGKPRALEASTLFSQAIAADSRNARAYWELGWSQQIAGDFDSAITTWETLKTLDPQFPDLEAFTAIAMTRRGERPPEPPAPVRKSKAHHRADMETDLAR
ncbi:MAG: hypothetical protein H7Z43_02605 [Clostridia bacterium]|nr:hypothetical protein [Deltaproteobacteria bacterium]